MTSPREAINIAIDLSMGVDYPSICTSCVSETCETRSNRVIICVDYARTGDSK